MSKQNHVVASLQEKQKQQKNRPAIVTQQADGQVPVTELPGRLMPAAGHSSTQVQATGFSDRRFHTAQRQAIAAQLGRVGGNQHLQKVMVQANTGSESVQMNRELDVQAFTDKRGIYFGNGQSPARDELMPGGQQSESVQLTSNEAALHPSPAPFVPAVQGAVVQRDKSKPDSTKTSFDRTAIETIKTNAERRHESITTFIRESRGTLQLYKSRLLEAATLYKAAFSRHKAVLDEAKEAAADRKEMISAIAGFAVGVAFGVPGAVARMGLKTVAQRATTAFAVGGELTELLVGNVAGWAAAGPDAKAFEPTAEIPELKELAVWRTIAEMSDKLLAISLLTAKQMKIVSAAGTAIAEIRLRDGGAKNLEKTDAELLALVNALKRADEASGEVAAGLQDAKAEIDQLGATPPRHMSVEEVEQDIWIHWIADLTDDDLLDEDDITDHLEDLGVIGEGRVFWDEEGGYRREPPRLDVDFGMWVSDEDEEDAVNAARAKLGRHTTTANSEGYYYDEE